MRLTCPNTHISASYRENHPAITVKCEKTGEFERLAQIIEHLFQPIKKNHVVDYSYSLQGRELDLRIGNQQSQKAISAVQSAKKDLKRFIDNYHERPDDEDDFWKFFRFYINFCTWVVAITLKILFIVTTISIGWLHRRLRKDLGLSSLQATAIISGLIAILMIITFWLTDAHRLFLSESSTTPQPIVTSSHRKNTNSVSTTSSTSESSSIQSKPFAKDFLQEQYLLINQHQYQKSWERLSLNMRQDTSIFVNGYDTYIDWWTTVNLIEVESIDLINETSSKAILTVNLKYYMNNNKVCSEERQVTLFWDEKINSWLIVEARKI